MGAFQNWEPREAFTYSVLPVTVINTPWKSPVLYFKVLHIQEPYLCILSGWLLLYKAVSLSQDGMCRAGGWTNANVGSPTQLLMAHAWREAGTLQVPEQWCYLCYRCLCTFPAQRSFPPEHCLHPTSHPTRKVCASQWKGQGIFLFQQKYCMQKKTTKSPAILISIVKTKPLKKKPNKPKTKIPKPLHNNALKKTGLLLNCVWLA